MKDGQIHHKIRVRTKHMISICGLISHILMDIEYRLTSKRDYTIILLIINNQLKNHLEFSYSANMVIFLAHFLRYNLKPV